MINTHTHTHTHCWCTSSTQHNSSQNTSSNHTPVTHPLINPLSTQSFPLSSACGGPMLQTWQGVARGFSCGVFDTKGERQTDQRGLSALLVDMMTGALISSIREGAERHCWCTHCAALLLMLWPMAAYWLWRVLRRRVVQRICAIKLFIVQLCIDSTLDWW